MSSEIMGLGGTTEERPTDQAANSSRSRLLYIDNIRILLTILVILHHLAVGYGSFGIWYYNEPGPLSEFGAVAMLTFLAVNQAFFMGFFFMISSYFIPRSYDHKGARRFSVDRLVRLGIPLLFYVLLIAPFLSYLVRTSRIQFEITYFKNLWTYSLDYFKSYLDIGIDVGPMWFVAALLLFTFIYVFWRVVAKSMSLNFQTKMKTPSNAVLFTFALVLGFLTFIIRIKLSVGWEFKLLHWQFPHFAQYIAFFIVGIFAYRNHWFEGLTKSQGRLWAIFAIILIIIFPIFFMAADGPGKGFSFIIGGLHWQSLFYSVWEQFLCVAMVVSLLVWFRDRHNRQGAIAVAMAASAYATYIFHAPVIVLLAKNLSGVKTDLAFKFLWVAPIAVFSSFLVGFLVKKLPVVRRIL